MIKSNFLLLSQLLSDIVENITLVDPTNKHKKEYGLELMRNLEYMKNKDVLLSTLFDPKYILIDQNLPDKVVLDCRLKFHKSPSASTNPLTRRLVQSRL